MTLIKFYQYVLLTSDIFNIFSMSDTTEKLWVAQQKTPSYLMYWRILSKHLEYNVTENVTNFETSFVSKTFNYHKKFYNAMGWLISLADSGSI